VFVVTRPDGTLGAAREAPGIARLNAGGGAGVSSVSCAAAGNRGVGVSIRGTSGAASLQIGGGELAEPVPAETGVVARVDYRDRQRPQAFHGHAVLVNVGIG